MKSLISISMVVATTLASAVPHSHANFHERIARELSTKYPTSIPNAAKLGYKSTWIEKFKGKAGSIPSEENWIFDLGTSYPGAAERWGNNEFESYTKDPENVQITKKGYLAIIPRLKNGQWTSARIETQRKDFVAAEGGKMFIESKIKIGGNPKEFSQGIWPAFWSLGSDFRGNYTNWPYASEHDFLEIVNGGQEAHHTVHCGYSPGGPCNEYSGIGSGPKSFTRGIWNTVGFEVDRTPSAKGNGTWRDEKLTWYRNGETVFNVTGATVGDKPSWVKIAQEPHFLLFNVAVGGNWPGPPNNATRDGPGAGMEVDYVGVWNTV